ncbi:suppressor of cytokine signaling 2-like [Electrophorus electricus]|uniref:suppressor of cytokine signaling 2-like n=1 Tax=Electrophorus electricus TaxID=8005 RepID=UPI0015CFE6E7|nr:suppressor of cytokine signaling 2-like [Electrophorus electricus]XP_035378536.1 suppressor of cytokine signaling 2-like [Electrophorus electricus]XP_035378537.1 suppressor of cytokine signaling 2-like [Electrophorus electricus]
MGHTQCISKATETEAPPTHSGDCGLDGPAPTLPLSCRVPLPNLRGEKCPAAGGVRSPELEPSREASTHDAERLRGAMTHLYESGWYWGSVTASEAKRLLLEAVDGTFLLRDSSNPAYLLTLSVRTALGTTHLRIEYAGGNFGFDSAAVARPRLRQFKGAVDLVQHYALAHRREAESGHAPAQVGPETPLQLKLTRPLCKAAPSLQHLCRVAINRHSRNHTALSLPGPLTHYLMEYPFLL